MPIASIIMAAGRGSRMKEYDGNKTLLPLIPGDSPYRGRHPILLHIVNRLPDGPKCVIINHRKEEVIRTMQGSGIACCEQPVLNGTGGALLAAREFIYNTNSENLIITMGDVPFVSEESYSSLVEKLSGSSLVILGFTPRNKKQYGLLDISEEKVNRIVEWKYWGEWPPEKQAEHTVCNAGIYAARKKDLIKYLPVLASRPQKIFKEIDGKKTEIEEYFITDMVEFMTADGLSVGYTVADKEMEAMGVDDLDALKKAQEWFKNSNQ